ncbi:MAG TPA: AAA family ATPase [Longimicrobiales bacterium]
MERRIVRAAVISTDEGFLGDLRRLLAGSEHGVELAVEIAAHFDRITEEHLKELRAVNPELIFIDLEGDPETGIRLAQFLAEANPLRRFVAVGPTLSPELLLEAMRAGISEYVPKPATREALSGALERVERKLGATPREGQARPPGRLLAFFSAKGGSGSTTLATNVAIHLHRLTGRRTLLVDLDLELGEVALFLGVQPRFNFVDMIRNFHRMDAELLASFIERHDTGVHLLSAPYQPEKAEVVTADQIRKILSFLKQHYDYVIVDTPKSFSPATQATLEQAETVFLTTNVDLPSLRNIKRCLPLLERVLGRTDQRLCLVVNRYHPRDVISLQDVERTLGMKVYWTLANDYEAVIRSINTGKPVVLDGSSAYTADVKALAAEIAGLSTGQRRARRGLARLFAPLARLWGGSRRRRAEAARP